MPNAFSPTCLGCRSPLVQRQAGELFAGSMAEIIEVVRRAEAVNGDETGWRDAGRKAWRWVGTTAFAIHRSRGHHALEALPGDATGVDPV